MVSPARSSRSPDGPYGVRCNSGCAGREVVEVTAGLNAGDQVVAPASPQAGALKPGQRVTVKPNPPRAPAGVRP